MRLSLLLMITSRPLVWPSRCVRRNISINHTRSDCRLQVLTTYSLKQLVVKIIQKKKSVGTRLASVIHMISINKSLKQKEIFSQARFLLEEYDKKSGRVSWCSIFSLAPIILIFRFYSLIELFPN